VLFENFLHKMLTKLRSDVKTRDRQIVILMDNASIHKSPIVRHVARNFKVTFLLNAQYSPFLNPVEQLFGYLKRQMRKYTTRAMRDQVSSRLQKIMNDLNEANGVGQLWIYSLKAWKEILEHGYFRLA
jgi:transposase